MNYLILIFGILIVLGGVLLLVRSATIFSLFTKHANSVGLHLFAIVVRIALGGILIIGASESRFPVALQVLGWLSIFSAIVLAVIGRTRFQSLIKWALKLAPPFKGLAGVFAILLGSFLIYAVL